MQVIKTIQERPLMQRWLIISLMLVVVLVAFGVRVHLLGAQSFWYDEGVAYGHSQRSISDLIPALQNNVHVPAYFGLLALYEDFAGSSEFALRSLSALFSVLSVAFAFALGKRLYGPVAGLAAALFVALNTFSIYYAQETRMYAMLAAVGAASMWVYVGFIQRLDGALSRRVVQYGLALGLLNAVGIYTHYSYALVMVAQGIMAVLWFIALVVDAYRAQRFTSWRAYMPTARALGVYTAANLITIALFAPWLPVALSQVSAQPNISDPMPLTGILRIIQGWLGFGPTFEAAAGMGIVMYFFLLFGFVILPDHRRRMWWFLLLPVMWVLVSAGAYLYLELYTRYLRFLLAVQIGFAVWMGRGVWILWRMKTRERAAPMRYLPKFAAVFAALAFAYTLAQGLTPLYHDAAYQRDDYRGLVQTITQEAQPNDAIILSAPGLQEIFGYYYSGDIPVYPLPTSDDTAGDTQRIINTHDRIFTVLYGTAEQDPDAVVEHTLNAQAYPISDVWWDDVRLLRYATPQELAPPVTVNAQLGDHIMLLDYALNADTLRVGDALQIQLRWQTDAPLSTRYKVFLQLLNRGGFLAGQRDSEPAGGLQPTTIWQPDTIIVDNHAIPMTETLRGGTYTLIVGLYNSNDPSARLPVANAAEGAPTDYIVLDSITVR